VSCRAAPASPPACCVIRGAEPAAPQRAPNGLHPECLTQEIAALLRGEIDRIQSRIDCLARNRDALRTYPDTVQPGPLRPADS
jgi:hypothetical protein